MVKKVIAYTDRDTVKLIFPAPKGQRTTETYNGFVERLKQELVPEGADSVVVQENELPGYSQFSEAYRIEDGKVVIDMTVAKEVHLVTMLSVRDEKEQIAQNEEIAAFLDGDDVARQIARDKKLALRDLENTIDMSGINTPQELSEYWPDILK